MGFPITSYIVFVYQGEVGTQAPHFPSLDEAEKFRKFISAINDEQWSEAAVEMMDSRWAKQVGPRAERLRDVVLNQAS